MRSTVTLWGLVALVVATSWSPSVARGVAETGQGPAMTTIRGTRRSAAAGPLLVVGQR